MNGKKTTSTAECNHESFCFKLNPIDWGVWGMSNNSNQKIFIKILILCFHFPVKLKREQHQKNKLKLFVVWNELFSSFIRFFFFCCCCWYFIFYFVSMAFVLSAWMLVSHFENAHIYKFRTVCDRMSFAL